MGNDRKRRIAWLGRCAAWTFIAILVIGLAVFTFPRVTVNLLRAIWPSGIVWRGPTDKPVVYLTFDDGPDPENTPRLLDTLARQEVKATFFLVGERAASYPDIVARICAEGHEIGNHGNTWGRTIQLSDAEFKTDLARAEEQLSRFACYKKIFRPAAVMIRRSQVEYLHENGYQCVLGSAYAFDPARPPVSFLVWATRQALEPGAIVVLHDAGETSRQNSIAAVPGIISGARAKGLRFSPVSDIFLTGQ